MQYEIVLTLRARDGTRTVSSKLLPEVIAASSDSMMDILISMQTITMVLGMDEHGLAELGMNDIFSLANRVEGDVHNNKYKWSVEKE